MKFRSFFYSPWLFGFVVALVGGYIGWLLTESLQLQFGDEEQGVGGFFRFLLSYVLLVVLVLSLSWLNFRGPFRWWLLSDKKWTYWTWLVLLTWLTFEGLQFRQGYEQEFVDENVLVTLVFVGVVIGFGYVADAFRVRREQLVLQQQKTEAELRALKSQINPHFLFNALNTIYNEADAAQNDKVSELVQQLAGIMRFTLQETQKDFTSVEREIEFLEKYLALQQARLPKRKELRIDVVIEYDGQPARIAPLLLIPFVENAFQYGVSLQQDSFIELKLTIEGGQLSFWVRNSISPQAAQKQGHGTGIKNVQQRLELIYPNRYQLSVATSEGIFDVLLGIKLKM
ncbi:sensor histidine kinase [Runella limosa]|uniref:sensor histidine kinase n=1 Tax=Runella limosa TaxID=370978 RepID=UPI00041CB254|nr:histidine kinase [Runella limosa]